MKEFIFLGVGVIIGAVIGFILGLNLLKERIINATINEKMINNMIKPFGINASKRKINEIVIGARADIKKGVRKGGSKNGS